jgi:Tfp pilus assembly protein PilX
VDGLRHRLAKDERGIALVLALAICVALSLMVSATVVYVTANQSSAKKSAGDNRALAYAEAGLQTAYSTIFRQNTIVGGNPVNPALFGCATGTSGASDCTTITTQCVSVAVTCSGSTPQDGTARIYGIYGGLTGTTYQGWTVAKSTWLLVSTGFAYSPTVGRIDAKTEMAKVLISPLSAGGVASLWNHIFVTAQPTTPASCQLNFSGNSTIVDVPVYTIGNVCLAGQGVAVKEMPGGQKIDLMVGGVLSMSGGSASVGDYSTTPATPITSGVVQGGCTTSSTLVGNSGYPSCTNGSFRYSVSSTDTYISNDAPDLSATQMQTNFQTFDPGPKHACASGGTLAATVFDNSIQSDLTKEPDASGASFELTPASSDYTCVSQSGSTVGQLSWNHSTGVLTVSGSIFLDGNVTIASTATYTGTAIIEAAGTITFTGNNQTVCNIYSSATKDCDFTNWQGSSTNKSMLTLAALNLKGAAAAINFAGNAQSFQGSIWMPSTSQITFAKNGVHIEGPIAVGSFDATFNNAVFEPLPVITNMPVGAPIPPNTSASIGPLLTVK